MTMMTAQSGALDPPQNGQSQCPIDLSHIPMAPSAGKYVSRRDPSEPLFLSAEPLEPRNNCTLCDKQQERGFMLTGRIVAFFPPRGKMDKSRLQHFCPKVGTAEQSGGSWTFSVGLLMRRCPSLFFSEKRHKSRSLVFTLTEGILKQRRSNIECIHTRRHVVMVGQ
jgi:hypothetical protein